MRSLRFLFVLFTFFAGVHCVLQAQRAPGSPPDLRFEIHTRNDQDTFRIGEVIPLELRFSSTSKQKHELDMATYDRSGRLNSEKFDVQPRTGWTDPLRIYFRAYKAFVGGGVRGSHTLSAKPTIIELELNEWVRFEQPGQYHISVVSSRLGAATGPSSFSAPRQSGIAASNELELTIIAAEPLWQAQTLARATVVLDSGSRQTQELTHPGLPHPWKDAVKTLRYLGTPAAAREMAKRLPQRDTEADFSFGLIGLVGSPAAATGRVEMERLLTDADYPVDRRFLETLAVVALGDNPTGDIVERRDVLEAFYRERLAGALSQKHGVALAVSTSSIVEDAALYGRDLSAGTKTSLTAQLIATFDQLPGDKKADLLEYRWDALDHQAMLPLLREVAQQYRDFPYLHTNDAYQFNRLSGAALRRWYEVAPTEARPTIIQEILRPEPRFAADVLGLLPDKDLPQVEQSLVEHLKQCRRFDIEINLASLIHRYATANVEEPVLKIADQRVGRWACDAQTPILAYLLKVDPAAARSRVQAALAARGQGFSACNRDLLLRLGRLQNHPILEELAVKSLHDPDPEVAASAAAYQAQYGPPVDEHPGEHRPITIRFVLGDPLLLLIGQSQIMSMEAARQRIAQFPVGTVFSWVALGAQPDREKQAFEELSSFAAQHGMSISREGGEASTH